MTQATRQWAFGLIGILLIQVGGCRHPVSEPEMGVALPERFSATGTTPVLENWWQAFADETLDGLIARALADNFTLQSAWDRLVQAHAVARQTDAVLWPEVDLEGLASRTRQRANGETDYAGLYSVGVAAGFELDLWSRLRASRQAAWLDAQATREALDSAAITLSASVANTWFQLAEAKMLVRIVERQIQSNEKVLEIVTMQFRNGVASAADVLRQRQLVASTRARLISAQETVALLQYTLSVLLGTRPELAWQQAEIELPVLPPMPATGIPAEVLMRRPDVRQAYRQVQAADQRLAVAIANQYPRISLSASVETSATSVRDLFDDWLANLAGNLVQPLFDADQRKAEVQRQKAVVREELHTWSQTILEALQDIETALTQEQHQRRLVENLNRQLGLARQTYERNRESFMKGQVDYIYVLDSLESLQALELNVVTAQRALIQRRIDLYRSIAGPCDLPRPTLVRSDGADLNSHNLN